MMNALYDRFFLKSLQNAQANRDVVRMTYTVKGQNKLQNWRYGRSDGKDDSPPRAITASIGSDTMPTAVTRPVTSDTIPVPVTRSETFDKIPTAVIRSVTSDTLSAAVTKSGTAVKRLEVEMLLTEAATSVSNNTTKAITKSTTSDIQHPAVTRSVTFDTLPTVRKKRTIFNSDTRLVHKRPVKQQSGEHLPSILEHPKHLNIPKTINKETHFQPRESDVQEILTSSRKPVRVFQEKTILDDPRFCKLENLLHSSSRRSWKQSQSMVSFQKKEKLKIDVGQTQSLDRIIVRQLTKSDI